MKTFFGVLLLFCLGLSACHHPFNPQYSAHDLTFTKLATSWDEGIPLGNGMVGALVWNHDGKLRLSLDRADLWDLRPMKNLDVPEWNFNWVYDQWKKNDYRPVQEQFDVPYDRDPAPSKIPAAALEFDISRFGQVDSVRCVIQNAVCEVKWKNGIRLLTYVQANAPAGWFRFEGISEDIVPKIIPPNYQQGRTSEAENPVSGQDLRRLGYDQGTVAAKDHELNYIQEGWGGFQYQVNVRWHKNKDVAEGVWGITSQLPQQKGKQENASIITENVLKAGFNRKLDEHLAWWKHFWSASSIAIPDEILEKQWYLEQYKFGSAARKDAPPISLQSVWTADNGKLPPWKGDFHHDLNTQLSYWPSYSANHLDLEEGFINWLWDHRETFKKYTTQFYGTKGLNVPGVTTLEGEPMGGWIQYSFGPTVAAWLGQHFYWHWKYSMDTSFLRQKAYPWISEVAQHLEELSVRGEDGWRKLPLSSSPEINDNSRDAWFDQTTNYDLALIRWTYTKSAELAGILGKMSEAAHWQKLLSEWPDFAIDDQEGFMIAPNVPFHESHRHFSHQMAYHPLGLVDWSNGKKDQQIITNTIHNLEKNGTDWWCGYSFSWMGSLYARAFDGDKAAEVLRTFATCFCLPNSFHVNGDQSGTGKSKFTYRPFTLEGNFAFAAGLQEMLLQSHTGVIHIFPAIPGSWENAEFHDLRAQGAFLVTAKMQEGKVDRVQIMAEKGGMLRLLNPFKGDYQTENGKLTVNDSILEVTMKPGQVLTLKSE